MSAWTLTSSARHRLVQDQHLRAERQGPGDPDPLALPAGELVRIRGRPGAGPAARSRISSGHLGQRAPVWLMPCTIIGSAMLPAPGGAGAARSTGPGTRSAGAGAARGSRRGAWRSGPRRWNAISPLVGSTSRRMHRPVVDLPQPDSPTSPSTCPGARSKETPSTAVHASRPRIGPPLRRTGNSLTRLRTDSSGVLIRHRPGAGARGSLQPGSWDRGLAWRRRDDAGDPAPSMPLELRVDRPGTPRPRSGTAARTRSRAAAGQQRGGVPGIAVEPRRWPVEPRHAGQQRPGVRVPRVGEQLGRPARPRRSGPPYITATRSTTPATTPRSWVISTSAMSRSSAQPLQQLQDLRLDR